MVCVWLVDPYTGKDVATKEPILDVILIPSGLLIVEESRPFLGHQCPAWVPILKVGDDAVQRRMSNVV